LSPIEESCTAGPKPVPLRFSDFGPLRELSTRVILAESAPIVCGANLTTSVQVDPGGKVEPVVQVELAVRTNDEALVPVTLTLVNDSVPLPVFVNTIVSAELDVPRSRLPNFRLVGLRVTVAAIPVPLRPRLLGPPTELSVRLTEAVFEPVDGGANVTLIMQVKFG
jgi:hypothetical protein